MSVEGEKGEIVIGIGSKAPAFVLESDEEKKVALKDFAGGKLVLYFYPKDNTSG